MAKSKTAFVCTDCGSDYSKWQGQCIDCNAWNTISEVRLGPAKGSGRVGGGAAPARAGYAGGMAPAQVLQDRD